MRRLELLTSLISQTSKILVTKQPHIGILTLNSPKDLNALSAEMRTELAAHLKTFNDDPSVSVIVIRSALPNIFCAGANIKELQSYDYETRVHNQFLHSLDIAFKNSQKPILALIDGKALGGGFELALLCDIILCSEKAYFALPEINLGLFPGLGGTQRLPRIIGEKRAMKCILSGEGLTATQAANANIAQLIPSSSFQEQSMKLVKKIAEKSDVALILAKKCVKAALETTLQQGLEYEKNAFYGLLGSLDAKEGVRAFVEKRKPKFLNK